MHLSMKRHARRSDSRYIQFYMRVPESVRERVQGRVVTVELPAHGTEPAALFEAKLGQFIRGSLHTRNAETADTRHLLIRSHLSKLYAAVRVGPAPITQRQIEALAGDVYRLLLAEHGENPGTPWEWESFKSLTRAAVEGRIPGAPTIPERGRSDDELMRELLFGETEGAALTETINRIASSSETRALEQRVGRLAFWTLQRRGIEVDDETRLVLLRRIAVAALDAGHALKRMAGGDYRADPAAERFPPFQAKGKAAVGVRFTDLFARWKQETKPAGSTVTTWKAIFSDFERHVKHGDASRVTDVEVVAWKDARVAAGRSPKTINDSDLACLRALFRFGVVNKILSRNPAEGVKVSAKKRAGEGRLPYSNDDIARLLKHAEGETATYRRWLPLLLVTTGARVGELAQLSADRVRIEDGVHVLRLEPAADGGSLKNDVSERTVPMHPALVGSGFIAFARSKEGPLFYGARPRRQARTDGEGRHASKSVSNRLSDWIRTLDGFDDPRKGPAHSTRHWWKSVSVRAGIADSVADYLQGHAATGVAGRYRHHDDIKSLAEAVAKIPIPTLKRENDTDDAAAITDEMVAPAMAE
ncbi:Tyrosine recombinase XerC [Methylobacterium mesophilicum]|uniref:tyrosine-type recombinase/integrase n=1 Tax=Methylobacterium mesophilicum TaxID=39956 RepID=UPI001EE3564C|nr:tyrosine-type recombinase/integrase [Methylobacterium mesophilicum]GJE24327.1 Tyrosine recombinase XerC [Methylobacterium mesophilicum]